MDINSIHTDFEEESGAAPYIHTHRGIQKELLIAMETNTVSRLFV